MAILAESPPNRNGKQGEAADYPPVALGRLDDRSRWHWLSPRPVGTVDWTLTLCVIVLAIPVVVVFGSIVLIVRAFDRVAGKVGA